MTLTPEGFKPRRLAEIKADIEAEISEAFGDPDLRAESIWGQQIGIYSELQALMWQLAEDVYLSQYPDTATGVSLDHVASLTGIVRIPATPTQVTATAYGDLGVRLLAGREAANGRTGDVYRSTSEVRINATDAVEATVEVATVAAGAYTVTLGGVGYTFTAGASDDESAILAGLQAAVTADGVTAAVADSTLVLTVDDPVNDTLNVSVTSNLTIAEAGVNVPMLAVVNGAQLLPSGDLSEIRTPVAGWDRVGNLDEGIVGNNRETDSDLRARRQKSIQITATNTLDAITARLRQTPLVTDLIVYENNGIETNNIGVPRQHIWAIVEGGDDDAIAQVIYDTRAGGIGMKGDLEVLVRSPESGRDYPINFDRPRYVEPDIVVQFTALDGAPSDIPGAIKAALSDKTFIIGESIIYSRLYGIITCEVPGVQIDDLVVKSQRSNIAVDPDQKVRFLASRITAEAT